MLDSGHGGYGHRKDVKAQEELCPLLAEFLALFVERQPGPVA